MTAALDIERFSFKYGTHTVLEDIGLTVPESVMFVILGRNGSGKSTLLHCIAGILSSYSGSIRVMGQDVRLLAPLQRASLLGFLGQKHKSAFPFTVEDVVLTGRAGYVRFIPHAGDRKCALRAMERAGITHLRNRIYTELSGGEQQLVMIARSLAQEPKLLLLDEPVSHLDYPNQHAVMSLFRRLVGEGITVVAVLHDPNLAIQYGDSIAFVHNKRVILEYDRPIWKSDYLKPICGEMITAVPYRGKAYIVPDEGWYA